MIFTNQIITDKEVIDYWLKAKTSSLNVSKYKFLETSKYILIHDDDRNLILNPARNFLEGRILKNSIARPQKIEIKARTFIESVYLFVNAGGFLFIMMMIFQGRLFAIPFLVFFIFQFWWNYTSINKAIVNFKLDLEDMDNINNEILK